MKKRNRFVCFLLVLSVMLGSVGALALTGDETDSVGRQITYLWEEGNMPSSTVYTNNNSGYADPPDFRPSMVYYPANEGTAVKGAVMICAGGAFQFRSPGDEAPVAAGLNELGYHCFVVNYRLRPYTQEEAALDLARAVRYVRSNAEELGIDENDIATIGFSAGGILCGEQALNFTGSVDGTALDSGYVPDELDKVSADVGAVGMIYSFYGRLSVASLDVEKFAASDLPPTYYLYGSEEVFRSQIEANAAAVEQAGVSVESRILPGLPHGFGGQGDWFDGFDVWLSDVFAANGSTPATPDTEDPATPTPTGNPFTDVSADAWYAEAVAYVRENGLMSGVSDTAFAPNTTMTRAMLATVLWRMDGSPAATGSLTFADVPADTWYTEAVRWAVQNEIVAGYSPQTFGSDDPVTREQIATILLRYEQQKRGAAGAAQSSGFADAAQISSWAAQGVSWASENGVMNGKPGNLFDPSSGATRAEVATVLMNYQAIRQEPQPPEASSGKSLVVYFSMPETTDPEGMTQEEENSAVVIDGVVLGNTQYVAYIIQEHTGADIFRIEPVTPYPTDHDTLVDLAADEQDENARPRINATVENIDQYDTIFLGYPNWWGDMPMILYTFIEEYDLSGKTIIPFNTHGGSGFSNTINTIAQLQPDATVERNGYSVSRNNVHEARPAVISWLTELGF